MSCLDTQVLQAELCERGFVLIRGAVPEDLIEEFGEKLLSEYERARSTDELFKGGGSISGHLNCYPGAPARPVYDQLVQRGLLDVVGAVDPLAVTRVRPTLNFNLPGSTAQHYHTDGLFTEAFVICNVAVVDTDEHNGAIDLLPGTHHDFCPYWRFVLERRRRLSTRVSMSSGDVLLRMSTVWHRGMPNRSSSPRPLLSLTFGEASAPEGDPFDLKNGRIYFYPNWFSTSRLGRLRERAFVTVPLSYSTYRFARSVGSNRGYSSW
jgi:hypothetical protein